MTSYLKEPGQCCLHVGIIQLEDVRYSSIKTIECFHWTNTDRNGVPFNGTHMFNSKLSNIWIIHELQVWGDIESMYLSPNGDDMCYREEILSYFVNRSGVLIIFIFM